MKWSQGRAANNGIVDRSREHLGSTDAAIVRVRHRLLEAARALQERGTEPPCVDTPQVYLQRSGWVILPQTVDYWDGARERREEFQAELRASTSGIGGAWATDLLKRYHPASANRGSGGH
jgi:hypothetical protein